MTLREKFRSALPFNNYRDSVKLEKIVDTFSIGFAEWLRRNYYSFGDSWMPFDSLKGGKFTNKQLLEIYKKEKYG